MPPVTKDAKTSGGVTRKESFMRALAKLRDGIGE